MNLTVPFAKTLLSVGLASALLSGCVSSQKIPDGAANVRQQLIQLQGDQQLAVLAPLAIKDAEQAVILAEQPQKNAELASHRVLMAERKVALASTQAQTRLLESQRKALRQQRDDVRLNARTLEAKRARADASDARSDAEQARLQASNARAEATDARNNTEQARRQAMMSANREQIALSDARSAREQADTSDAKAAELRTQLAELNARPTDRGLVITLGDVLFDTGMDSLRNGSSNHLDKLALFLKAYPERTAQIEGHTDDVGSDGANMLLSQRRAETVKAFLLTQGVADSRLNASGKGESEPLASNATADGRQQNRRVEVIIADAVELADKR
ncbi:OmpA family protein [Bowmanella dokdonensis]|uniref:OmpA family protein n=1 Tax=Bowmanella dokdonensis TaxID=751969 RepID=A0A939DPR2_9ALTE|nr:OmpA family protein [Bowmanella dokdonensis]MBN7826403.1 OmpA family protein [Bowmanella dokdonensis]